MHQTLSQSFSTVFFSLDCNMRNTLDSEVYLRVHLFVVRHKVSLYGIHADESSW